MNLTYEESEIVNRALAILENKLPNLDCINNPESVRSYLRLRFSPCERELFGVLFMNNQHVIISFEILFKGSIDRVDVYPRIVAQRALFLNSSAVILVHNHPSCSTEPSQADRLITERIKKILKELDVRVLDHMIIAGNEITSFAEKGLL